MNSANQTAPSDFQSDLCGANTSSPGFKALSSFRILENPSPAENEAVCKSNGFPGFSDVIELPEAKPVSEVSKIDTKSDQSAEPVLPSALAAFEAYVKNLVLNPGERKVLSMLNGIVRQVADFALSTSDISNLIQRILKNSGESVDLAKIAAVLNYRLRDSDFKHASVALQISNRQEFFTVNSRGKTVLKVPVNI